MIIACPRCETTFSLPDDLYKPGKKARCSQCGFVFPMPESSAGSPSAEPAPGFGENAPPLERKKKFSAFAPYKKGIIIGAAVVLLLLLLYGAWLVVSSFMSGTDDPSRGKSIPELGEPKPVDNQAEYQRLINSVSLDEIRQFVVDNHKIGKLMVIQGFAINISDSLKDYVTVEARLLDEQNRVLASRKQLCGPTMNLFQLQNLDEREIKEVLNNRITILTNNTNVQPGTKVPFVVLFPTPPDTVRTFEVRVIDVREAQAR